VGRGHSLFPPFSLSQGSSSFLFVEGLEFVRDRRIRRSLLSFFSPSKPFPPLPLGAARLEVERTGLEEYSLRPFFFFSLPGPFPFLSFFRLGEWKLRIRWIRHWGCGVAFSFPFFLCSFFLLVPSARRRSVGDCDGAG